MIIHFIFISFLKCVSDLFRCKGFLIQRAPINERTCKHLKEYLGEEFDQKRLEASKKPKKPSIKSHIQVSVLLAKKYDEKYVLFYVYRFSTLHLT